MWEDDRNRQGGRWLFMLNKKPPKAIDEMWLEILLCLVGEAFGDESDQICGAVINVRPRMDKIAVWTSNCKDEKAVASIGYVSVDSFDFNVTDQRSLDLQTDPKEQNRIYKPD